MEQYRLDCVKEGNLLGKKSLQKRRPSYIFILFISFKQIIKHAFPYLMHKLVVTYSQTFYNYYLINMSIKQKRWFSFSFSRQQARKKLKQRLRNCAIKFTTSNVHSFQPITILKCRNSYNNVKTPSMSLISRGTTMNLSLKNPQKTMSKPWKSNTKLSCSNPESKPKHSLRSFTSLAHYF